MEINKSIDAGQAIYTKRTLFLYDIWVLSFSNSFIWKCPTKILMTIFQNQTTLNHLDVGVGTGYYIDKCLSNIKRRIGLLDVNKNSLNFAANRIRRFKPELYLANVLEPLNIKCKKFDSISVNYLLHCLSGSMKEKSIIFKYLSELLNAGGTIFGSTILSKGSNIGYIASKLMAFYNKKGIFDNLADNLLDLEELLQLYFYDIEIKIIGCVAIFLAKKR